MKPLATFIGIAAAMLLFSTANAQPYDFVWDGGSGTNGSWDLPANWDIASCPGHGQAGDTATIDANTTWDTVTVRNTVPFDVTLVRVDAETADCALTLEINTADIVDPADLNVHTASNHGHTLLKAGSHSSTVDDDATLWICDGTLRTDAITFHGSANSSLGYAIGDFDANMTVRGAGGNNEWDTWVQGYAAWFIADDPNDVATVHMKDLELDGLNSTNLSVTGNGSTSILITSSFHSNGKPMSIEGVTWND